MQAIHLFNPLDDAKFMERVNGVYLFTHCRFSGSQPQPKLSGTKLPSQWLNCPRKGQVVAGKCLLDAQIERYKCLSIS